MLYDRSALATDYMCSTISFIRWILFSFFSFFSFNRRHTEFLIISLSQETHTFQVVVVGWKIQWMASATNSRRNSKQRTTSTTTIPSFIFITTSFSRPNKRTENKQKKIENRTKFYRILPQNLLRRIKMIRKKKKSNYFTCIDRHSIVIAIIITFNGRHLGKRKRFDERRMNCVCCALAL